METTPRKLDLLPAVDLLAVATAVLATLGNAASIISPRVSVPVHQRGLGGDDERFHLKNVRSLLPLSPGEGKIKG